MELTLAQPLRRMSFFLAKTSLALVGVVSLALCFWAARVSASNSFTSQRTTFTAGSSGLA